MIKTILLLAIYYNSDDYPNKYVVRRWRVPIVYPPIPPQPEAEPIVFDTLEDARASMPEGTTNRGRNPEDVNTCIVEMWL